MHYRTRDEKPCEAIVTINGVSFKCPRAGYVVIGNCFFCTYCADTYKCNERSTETNSAKAM